MTATAARGRGAAISRVPHHVYEDARQAFERRSRGVLVARLVDDRVGAALGRRELRFVAGDVVVDVDVRLHADGLLLTVRVLPVGTHRLLLRRPSTSTRVTTDAQGATAPLPAAPGPLSVVVLGPALLQTEWLVV